MTKKLQKTVTGARMSPKKAKMVIKAVSSTDKLQLSRVEFIMVANQQIHSCCILAEKLELTAIFRAGIYSKIQRLLCLICNECSDTNLHLLNTHTHTAAKEFLMFRKNSHSIFKGSFFKLVWLVSTLSNVTNLLQSFQCY